MKKHTLELHHCIPGAVEADDDIVLIEILDESISLAELICRTVEEEQRLAAMKNKVQRNQWNAIFARRYLSAADIEQQAQQGKVSFPRLTKECGEEPSSNAPCRAVQDAWQGFRDHAYCVFVNGRQIESLEEMLTFEEQNRIIFLRLMPLVGG